jgi:hypothetical protein
LKLLELFVSYDFEISIPLCCARYAHDGRNDILDIQVSQNVRLTETIVNNIHGTGHLPVICNIRNPVRDTEALDPFEELTGWELFQSHASKPVPPNIQIHPSNEAEKGACVFAVVSSPCKLSARESTILDRKYETHGAELKHKRRLGKFWQGTRDPACKLTANWFT